MRELEKHKLFQSDDIGGRRFALVSREVKKALYDIFFAAFVSLRKNRSAQLLSLGPYHEQFSFCLRNYTRF
jgi:hypothetical protein